MLEDTIVALSTALRPQAVSILRLSGDASVEIAEKLCHKDLSDADHRITYSHIYDPHTNEVLDEGLILVMKAPKTYTREDVVEIQCHGGVFVTERLLATVLSMGARLALSGEFTQRAVMNGRIDISQAQAVNDMVTADSKQSAQLAMASLKGSVKILIEPLVEELIQLIAQIEVNIDYPEYDIPQITRQELLKQVNSLITKLEKLLIESRSGQRMKEGVKTVIIGQPNVGKSSLLNALLEEDKAIVTDIPGTTRDVVEGTLHLENVTLQLLDTAGIRQSDDTVEKIGIKKTFDHIEKADLILFLVDGSKEMSSSDAELLESLDQDKVLLVHTKKDLNTQSNRLEISALHKDIQALVEQIEKRFEKDQFVFDRPVLSQARSIGLAQAAFEAMKQAELSLNSGMEVDLALIDIKDAHTSLQAMMGAEDFNLGDELFRRFCLGK